MDTALSPKSILLLAPQWVGDSVFMLPALSALKRRYPEAALTLAAKTQILALHRASPMFSDFVNTGGTRSARFAALLDLRARNFDLCLVFPPSFSSAFGAFLSGAKLRLGRRGQGRRLFLNRSLPEAGRQIHVADEYFELAKLAGAEPLPEDKSLRLNVTQEGAEEQNRLFREQGLQSGPQLIALCPTSAFGPSKRWQAEKFAALALKLKEQRYHPYVLGAPHEQSEVKAIAAAAGGIPVLLPGLPGLAACLAASGVAVANDSGPLHIAAAVGTRCVGIYGPVDPRWSSPLSHRSQIFYSGEACSPCFKAECPFGHHDCMKKIGVDEVYEGVLELLKR